MSFNKPTWDPKSLKGKSTVLIGCVIDVFFWVFSGSVDKQFEILGHIGAIGVSPIQNQDGCHVNLKVNYKF